MVYEVRLSAAARRALTDELPESVAAAVWEFLTGALAENPHRVGKPLRHKYAELHSARRGSYRIIYRIEEQQVMVEVIKISHRRAAYL